MLNKLLIFKTIKILFLRTISLKNNKKKRTISQNTLNTIFKNTNQTHFKSFLLQLSNYRKQIIKLATKG